MFSFLSQDMAIDLGTANTLVYVRGRGIVLNEPSVVAVRKGTNQRPQERRGRGLGRQSNARQAPPASIDRHPPPASDGVISRLRNHRSRCSSYFIRKVQTARAASVAIREIVICDSQSASTSRRETRRPSIPPTTRWRHASTYLIEEPIAAAIGAGHAHSPSPSASMIVDIGGGTTEVAVLSLKGLAYTTSVRVGGDKMDEAIINYVRRNFNMLIGEATAERIKKEIGTAKKPADGIGETVFIKGRDLMNGVPNEIQINQGQVAEALAEPVATIVEGVRAALENTQPELAADIVDQGIVLTGGGALLRDLDVVLREATGPAGQRGRRTAHLRCHRHRPRAGRSDVSRRADHRLSCNPFGDPWTGLPAPRRPTAIRREQNLALVSAVVSGGVIAAGLILLLVARVIPKPPAACERWPPILSHPCGRWCARRSMARAKWLAISAIISAPSAALTSWKPSWTRPMPGSAPPATASANCSS